MFSRFKPKLVTTWLFIGILFPGIYSIYTEKEEAKQHGVVVTQGSGSWYEHSIESALGRLGKVSKDPQEVSCYIWNKTKTTYLVVLKGKRKSTLILNGKSAFNKGTKVIETSTIEFPEGLSSFHLRMEPVLKEQDASLMLLWSDDFVTAEPIPAKRSYVQQVSKGTIMDERIAKILGIVARLNIVLLCLWLLIRFGRFSLFPANQSFGANVILVVILLAAAGLRIAGLGYQLQEGLHPDERLYGGMILQVRSGKLAPSQFWYTTGYFYITAGSQKLAEWILAEPVTQLAVQRAVSVIGSLLTCWLVFSIGQSLFSLKIGFLALLFFGFAFMPVELAHFGIVESTMVFFFMLAFASLVHVIKKPGIPRFLVSGIFAGFAIAVKQTAALIVLPFFITVALLGKEKGLSRNTFMEIGSWIVGAFLGFLVLSPATLFDFSRFYQYQLLQKQSLTGDSATHLFFVGRAWKFGALAWNGLKSGVGYPLIAMAAAGMLIVWRKSQYAAWLIVPTALAYLLVISKVETVPEHYVLLLVPFVALLAAVTADTISALTPRLGNWVLCAIALISIATSIPKTSELQKLLQGIDTRRQASEWCYRNLPAASRIDYEIFGPRFLIPMFDARVIQLFKRPAWAEYIHKRQPAYYVEDSLTTNIFFSSPDRFPVEISWYRSLKNDARILKEFKGNKFRLLNPDVRIYEIRKPL
jgi:Dolichyl-phosphate-mannose-protein mannosyltransferase